MAHVSDRERTVRTNQDMRGRTMRMSGAPGSLRAPRGSTISTPQRVKNRRFSRIDIAIFAGAALAASAPVFSPYLDSQSTRLLTQFNPLAERDHFRAERSVVVTPADAPTLWRGEPSMRATRDVAPNWVRKALAKEPKLPVLAALTSAPTTIELEAPPLWSRYIAGLERSIDPSATSSIETASMAAPTPQHVLPQTLFAGLPGIGPTAIDAMLAAIKIVPGAQGAAPVIDLFASVTDVEPSVERGGDASGPRRATSVRKLANGSEIRTFDFGDTAAIETSALSSPSPHPQKRVEPGGPAPGYAPVPRRRPDGALAMDRAMKAAARDAPQAAQAVDRDFQTAALKTQSAPRTPSDPPKVSEITMILTAVGINREATTLAASFLPREIAFALPPVTSTVTDIARAANATGRAVLLEAPLEPINYPSVNPGPMTLLRRLSAADNAKLLADSLKKTPGAVGVATYLGGGFLNDVGATAAFVDELERRGLVVYETQRTKGSHLNRLAGQKKVKAFSRIMSIDDHGRSRDLEAALDRLEARAKRDGHVIGVAVAIPTTVSALADWATGLESRGIKLRAIAR
jgi:polysaccharide deacetylase 2 family uncharacterized protein YibQ